METDVDEAGAIQGIEPARVIRADGAERLRDEVRHALDAGESLVDYGTFHRGLGHAPPEGHVRVLPAEGSIEHHVEDTTVRVGAGVTLRAIRAKLAEAGQHLPIDGAAGDLSIGEVIAHDVYGPLALGHGRCRDLLLGVRFVDGRGELMTVGGRTVKNVAGYDVTRLMIGSLNTLGVLAEATLKTAAIPEQVTVVEAGGIDPAELDALLTGLLTSDAAPWYLDQQTVVEGGAARHTLRVGYAGGPKGCDVQHAALAGWLRGHDLATEEPVRRDVGLADDERERAERRDWRAGSAGWVKVVVPPASTGQTARVLLEVEPGPGVIDALPAHGVLHVGAEWSVEQAKGFDASLGRLLEPLGGFRVWMRRPGDTREIAPFGPEQPDWRALGRVRRTFDPKHRLNPRRFA